MSNENKSSIGCWGMMATAFVIALVISYIKIFLVIIAGAVLLGSLLAPRAFVFWTQKKTAGHAAVPYGLIFLGALAFAIYSGGGIGPLGGVNSADDVNHCAVGTWTRTRHDGLWERIVIRRDGTFEAFHAMPSDEDWGSSDSGTWTAVTEKYMDTGKRWYGMAFQGGGMLWEGRAAILNGCSSFSRNINQDYDEFRKGDKHPFSK